MALVTTKRKFREVSTVTVLVGPTKSPFYVHHTILCDSSHFFKNAFESSSETQTQEIALPEVDTNIFETFVGWLYSRNFGISVPDEAENKHQWERPSIIDFFFFADKYGIAGLKACIMDKLFNIASIKGLAGFTARMLPKTWEFTTEEAGIRRLFVDWMVFQCEFKASPQQPITKTWLFEQPAEFNAALIIRFAERVKEHYQRNPFRSGSAEHYYDVSPEGK